MNEFDQKNSSAETEVPSAEYEFEQRLGRARELLQNADFERALQLLHDLEAQYVRASGLFDLLGEVLIRRGHIDEGLRYKKLHQILHWTLQLAREGRRPRKTTVDRMTDDYKDRLTTRGASDEPKDAYCPELKEETPSLDLTLTPMTASMAHELIRQGHLGQALEILNILVEQNPEDEALREVRRRAREHMREDSTLRTLTAWLKTIEQMKACRPTTE